MASKHSCNSCWLNFWYMISMVFDVWLLPDKTLNTHISDFVITGTRTREAWRQYLIYCYLTWCKVIIGLWYKFCKSPSIEECGQWVCRVSQSVLAKSLISISPQTCVTIPAVSEKLRSATIKTKEVWDFVQLTSNLDTISWKWRMREEQCKVDYPHSVLRGWYFLSRLSTWFWLGDKFQI